MKGDALAKFIQHHIVSGTVTLEDFKKVKQLKPRHGLPIEVSQTAKGTALGTDFKARIVESVECEGNIFIHKINHPLLSEYVDGIGDIEQMTLENTFYRRTVATSERAQIVLMSLVPGAWVIECFMRLSGGSSWARSTVYYHDSSTTGTSDRLECYVLQATAEKGYIIGLQIWAGGVNTFQIEAPTGFF